MLKRILTLLILALVTSQYLHAQVTTSSITGTAKSSTGQALAGATVVATHTPSGTTYSAIADKDGVFNLLNVRIGGPYELKITFSGLQPFVLQGFNLLLGQPYNVNAVLGENAQTLENVVVTAGRSRRSATDKTGASTNITTLQLATLPSITRSITDYTRLTPQAGSSVSANNTSFAGRDGRLNNVTVDGANLNNNFGLSTDLLPGGGNPISLDAIDEISINVAPFDVRQSGFTGAGISAVTKSGTNTFHGSVYGAYRDQSFNGTHVGSYDLPTQAAQKNKIIGATIGGPIIKNKLFFFLNGEYETRTYPGITWKPTGGTGSGNTSTVSIDSLRKLSDYLSKSYGYQTGAYDNFPNFSQSNHKVLGKIDWNISTAHKLTVKFSDYLNTNDVALNSLSVPNSVPSAVITSKARFGQTAMSFANSNYAFKDQVQSGSVELNSRFSNKIFNQVIATYTHVQDTRTSPSAEFPFVDILGPNGGTNNYMSFGYEPYSHNNDVINNTYTVTDNFSYLTGKHNLTGGVNYEFQKVGNMFMPASQSYYVYSSLNDFITNAAPKSYALTYSLLPGQDAIYSANLKIGQLGIYAQDEIQVNDHFRLTAGLRVDRPVYPEQPLSNAGIAGLSLYDKDGNLTNYTTGAWPKSSWYWSPRVGFRWDVNGDRSMVLRGGTGIFTGRMPFVYLTNIPSNSGMYQYSTYVTSTSSNTADMNLFKFNPNPNAYNPFTNSSVNTAYPKYFPKTTGSVPSAAYALTSRDYKFPQVWRTDFAVDKVIGKGWTATVEGIYSKTLNDVYMFNANQKTPDTVVVLGSTTRPRFSTSAARKLNSTSGNAIVLDNTNKGGTFVATAQLSKSFSHHWYGSLAYTYTFATDVTANPGSQANSVWAVNPTSNTQNTQELAYSNFATPHRVVANVSYRFEYIQHLASTISLFYEGASPGTFSYIYNGDVNNDGNSADLMYVPKDASEITFANLAASGSTPAFTAQQQSDAFFAYINQDKYLSKHKGQVTERNGAKYPWYNRVDMRFAQDIFSTFGNRKHTLQIAADVTNLLNLVNKSWGLRQIYVVNNPLKVVTNSSSQPVYTNGKPTYTLATYTPAGTTTPKLVDKTFINNNSTASTWGLQLSLRYFF